jgi:diguanylate cyclase (GGDEF)-like protein
MHETNDVCYQYWKKGKICDNCISIRAYKSNECFMKMEQLGETLIMVTAVPVGSKEKPTIVELMKNATDSMMMGTGKYGEGFLIKNVITQINNMIIRDQLTGLFNRRYVDERLPADIVKTTLKNTPLSLIFMDMDNLKEINDSFGHVYGDKMITRLTNVITSCIRSETDWAARYGGDEFVICLNNTNEQEAYKIAERIRKRIQDIELCARNKNIRTTVSLGIYTTKDNTLTAEEILSLADSRMYEAKQNGKNASVGVNIYTAGGIKA